MEVELRLALQRLRLAVDQRDQRVRHLHCVSAVLTGSSQTTDPHFLLSGVVISEDDVMGGEVDGARGYRAALRKLYLLHL